MSVVARIRTRNPKHGVLAIGEVEIDKMLKIKDVQLHRNNHTHEYRVTLPISEGRKSACIEILDEDLKHKITNALVACYEKGVYCQKSPLRHSSADLMEEGQVHASRSKYKDRNKEFYRKFR